MDPRRHPTPQEQRDKAAVWVNEKWTASDKTCPICGTNKWTVTEPAALQPYQNGSLVLGGPVFPVFLVICSNCAYTISFNAAATGVLEQIIDPPTAEPPSPEGAL